MLNLALHSATRISRTIEAKADAHAVREHAVRLANSLRVVEDELSRHALVLQGLLRMCLKKGLFADAEFLKLLEDIDLEDGVRDGMRRRTKEPKVCANCDKPARATAMTCLYCGTEFSIEHPAK